MILKRWKYLVIICTSLLLLVLYLIVNNRIIVDPYPPITLIYLDNQIIRFECLTTGHCYKNINLAGYFQVKNSLPHPIEVSNGDYVSPSSIYLTLWGSGYSSLININPISQQIEYLKLPQNSDLTLTAFENDKVIIGTRKGAIYIYQNGLLVKYLQLELDGDNGPVLEHLISVDNNTIVAVNGCPIGLQNKAYAEVFIINTENGSMTKKLLLAPNFATLSEGEKPLPGIKYAVRIDNVSKDLSSIYYFYLSVNNNGVGKITLGMFNTKESTEGPSTNNVDCINWMAGYLQYRGLLYSSKVNIESSTNATLIDMGNLKSIGNIPEVMQSETTGKMIVTPFGNHFLLGTDHSLLVMSLNGIVVSKYQLPEDLVNKTYSLLEYRN